MMEMKSKYNEKVKMFYNEMNKRGYEVKLDEKSINPFIYELAHIVTKKGYYHVAIAEKTIVDAPMEYSIKLVEKEFSNLGG